MRIKTLFKILRELRYICSVLKSHSDSLAVGNYVLLDNFRAMSLNDCVALEASHRYFDKVGTSSRMALIARKLNKIRIFNNKNKKSTEEYEAFYVANNYDKIREVKLFSFKQNKILTICTSAEEAKKQMAQYDLFADSYNMPRVKESKKYPNSFEISMVDLRPFPGAAVALSSIVDSTVKFNHSIEDCERISGKDLIKYSYENEDINSILKELSSKIDESILNLQVPVCIQHGDLSKDNIIFGESEGKTDFWWIDWEHSAPRIFFYDLFFYIINSAIYGDLGAYDVYMSGKADEEMEKLFSHFGLNFDDKRRKDYFLVFAVIFLKERVCDFARVEALKRYFDFIINH